MKKKKKQKYSLGTGKNGVVRHYIESPDETITESQIMMAKAREKAMNNGWAQGLDIFGNLAVQYGTSMMNSGGGGNVSAGGQAKFGGNIVSGGGNGGAFGQDFGDWMGNNSQALASGISLLPMLVQLAGPGFAFGGQVPGVPVEVEGQEVGQTPDGTLLDFKGPSHENGGIDIELPEGTEIFSKRVKVKGKTMAERKKSREKKLMSLEKLLSKSGDDVVLKNSIQRTKDTNAQEEAADQELQQMIGNMKKIAALSQRQQYKAAKSDNPNSALEILQNEIVPQGKTVKAAYGSKGVKKYKDGTGPGGIKYGDPDPKMPEDPYHYMTAHEVLAKSQNFLALNKNNGTTTDTGEESVLPGEGGLKLPNFTSGDILGMAGTLYSAFEPMKNTEANRAGDTPNINAYEDFGNDALDRIDEAKGYVAGQRDKALRDLEIGRTRSSSRNRNSARGVNTQRALDLATDVNINNAQSDIYDNFAKQMMQLVGQQAGLENQQDQTVMSGEQQRDLADRQDRDNYYTQLAQDISTKGEGIQTLGKMLNQNKANTVAEQAVNDSSINFQYTNGVLTDKAGNAVMTQGELEKSAKALGITVEEYINMINK